MAREPQACAARLVFHPDPQRGQRGDPRTQAPDQRNGIGSGAPFACSGAPIATVPPFAAAPWVRATDGVMAPSARAVVEVPCCARGTVPATASPLEEASSLFFPPRGPNAGRVSACHRFPRFAGVGVARHTTSVATGRCFASVPLSTCTQGRRFLYFLSL